MNDNLKKIEVYADGVVYAHAKRAAAIIGFTSYEKIDDVLTLVGLLRESGVVLEEISKAEYVFPFIENHLEAYSDSQSAAMAKSFVKAKAAEIISKGDAA